MAAQAEVNVCMLLYLSYYGQESDQLNRPKTIRNCVSHYKDLEFLPISLVRKPSESPLCEARVRAGKRLETFSQAPLYLMKKCSSGFWKVPLLTTALRDIAASRDLAAQLRSILNTALMSTVSGWAKGRAKGDVEKINMEFSRKHLGSTIPVYQMRTLHGIRK